MRNYFLPSNPSLSPNPIVLQVTPSNHLNRLGKHRFDFHLFNRVGGQLGLDDSADQKSAFAWPRA
jgi:hypothetical protein